MPSSSTRKQVLHARIRAISMNRREVLAATGAGGAWGVMPIARPAHQADTTREVRASWIALLRRLADPVLTNLANGTLKARMPIEQAAGASRATVTHLEALGRLGRGNLTVDQSSCGRQWRRTPSSRVHQSRRAVRSAVRWNPSSPDFLNFTRERQPLVDAAFLAQGILRAPRALRDGVPPPRRSDTSWPRSSRRAGSPRASTTGCCSRQPSKRGSRRWELNGTGYASTTRCDSTTSGTRATGTYGDGPAFHWDYYNSFVIQPMLLDVLDVCRDEMPAWKEMAGRVEGPGAALCRDPRAPRSS